MHDSTHRMVEHLVDACSARGVRAEQFCLADADAGQLAMLLVDAATLVLGTPTVLGGPHPKVAYAAILANLIRPKATSLAVIGSYGWGGKAVEQLTALIPNLELELLPPVLCRGNPGAADLEALERLADEIARRHAALGGARPPARARPAAERLLRSGSVVAGVRPRHDVPSEVRCENCARCRWPCC
jgi:flavorubredoxin